MSNWRIKVKFAAPPEKEVEKPSVPNPSSTDEIGLFSGDQVWEQRRSEDFKKLENSVGQEKRPTFERKTMISRSQKKIALPEYSFDRENQTELGEVRKGDLKDIKNSVGDDARKETDARSEEESFESEDTLSVTPTECIPPVPTIAAPVLPAATIKVVPDVSIENVEDGKEEDKKIVSKNVVVDLSNCMKRFCSWCFFVSLHKQVQYRLVGRSTFQCIECKNETVSCLGCKTGVARSYGNNGADNICYTCDGTFASSGEFNNLFFFILAPDESLCKARTWRTSARRPVAAGASRRRSTACGGGK